MSRAAQHAGSQKTTLHTKCDQEEQISGMAVLNRVVQMHALFNAIKCHVSAKIPLLNKDIKNKTCFDY